MYNTLGHLNYHIYFNTSFVYHHNYDLCITNSIIKNYNYTVRCLQL